MIVLVRPLFRPCIHAFVLGALLMPGALRQAHAQIEFGYKDRVFDQNYLLPDELAQSQITAAGGVLSAVFMMNPALADALSNPAVKEILGGQCAELVMLDGAPKEPLTDAQRYREPPRHQHQFV